MSLPSDFIFIQEPPKVRLPPPPESSDDENDYDDGSDSELEDLESQLDDLCSYAETVHQNQTYPAQVYLNTQTKDLFSHYEQHGTAVALRGGLERYFNSRSTVTVESLMQIPSLSDPLPAAYKTIPAEVGTSRMMDEESRDLVENLPFTIERLITIRPNVTMEPAVMEAYNKIFVLWTAEANLMLQHHIAKWGAEAIFRLGIQALYQSRAEGLFNSDNLAGPSLKQDTRLFLTEVFERHPDINDAEKRLIARAGDVSVETVEDFWMKLTMDRKYYFLARQYIASRELENYRRFRSTVVVNNQVQTQARDHPDWHRKRWYQEYQNRGLNPDMINHWSALNRWRPGAAFPQAPYAVIQNLHWMTPQIRDMMARNGYPGAEGDRFRKDEQGRVIVPTDRPQSAPVAGQSAAAMDLNTRRGALSYQAGYLGHESVLSMRDSLGSKRPAAVYGAPPAQIGQWTGPSQPHMFPSAARLSAQYGVPIIPNSAGLVGAPITNTNFPWMKGISVQGVQNPNLTTNQGSQAQPYGQQQNVQANVQQQGIQAANVQPQGPFQPHQPSQASQQPFQLVGTQPPQQQPPAVGDHPMPQQPQ